MSVKPGPILRAIELGRVPVLAEAARSFAALLFVELPIFADEERLLVGGAGEILLLRAAVPFVRERVVALDLFARLRASGRPAAGHLSELAVEAEERSAGVEAGDLRGPAAAARLRLAAHAREGKHN